MSKIVIGEHDGKAAKLDIDTLLRTRLLIQANSGKGKSWLLRRLAEQLFGKVQVIIIDPEGEFATLREKFDYVLVGKGGETAAHPKIAALTAQRLLELRASAVCDLYEMKPSERHSYVQLFLESLIDAPKTLWHPLIVILDEAHVYCPEKGAGESVASEAVIGMATRGRKRGYCLVPATQRLGKFRKDAAAEMLNIAIGGTFIDIDRKRAADALGVYGHDLNPFFDEIRLLERGTFYFLGPAISDTRILVKVGPVETTHPEAGSAKHAAEPPPTPDKIKAMLPKLADLPKEAEEKAKTEAELRHEIRSLKAQLSAASKVAPVVAKQDQKQQTVELKQLRAALETAMKVIAKVNAVGFEDTALKPEEVQKALEAASAQIVKAATAKINSRATEFDKLRREAASALKKMRHLLTDEQLEVDVTVKRNEPFTVSPPAPRQSRPAVQYSGNGDLSGSQVKILSRLAELMECTGSDSVKKEQLAAWAEYSPNSGGFNNYLGSLRSAGLIEYPSGGYVTITDEGRTHAQPDSVPVDSAEMLERAKRVLGGSEGRLLELLHDSRDVSTKAQLAEAAGFSPNSGGFNNYLGHMRTLGFVEYPQPGMVRAADWLYLD